MYLISYHAYLPLVTHPFLEVFFNKEGDIQFNTQFAALHVITLYCCCNRECDFINADGRSCWRNSFFIRFVSFFEDMTFQSPLPDKISTFVEGSTTGDASIVASKICSLLGHLWQSNYGFRQPKSGRWCRRIRHWSTCFWWMSNCIQLHIAS